MNGGPFPAMADGLSEKPPICLKVSEKKESAMEITRREFIGSSAAFCAAGAARGAADGETSVTVCKYGEAIIHEGMVFHGGDASKLVPISLLFHMVRMPGRIVLIDAGCNSFSIFGRAATVFVKPADLLRRRGIRPEDVTDILVSHHHSDHMEGVVSFPNARVVLHRAEVKPGAGYLKGRKGEVVEFDDAISLFDGRISMRRVGGHTPGSSVVVLPRPGRKTIVFAGDACYLSTCLSQRRPTGATGNLAESRAFIEKYASPEYDVRLCHDPDVLKDANGFLDL